VISSEYVLAVMTLARLILILVIFGHYIACGWCGISLLGPDGRTWKAVLEMQVLPSGDPAEEDSMAWIYFTSLHWSLTQFTPASMEVYPHNPIERIYNIVVILFAMVTFSSFVSSITNTMTHIRNIKAERTQEEATIRRFFSQASISSELASRVWWVLQQKRIHVDSRLKVSEVRPLKRLPRHILNDVLVEVHQPVIARHPMFAWFRDVYPGVLAGICQNMLLEHSVPPGEYFSVQGSIVTEMIFVTKGGVVYQDSDDLEEPQCFLSEGEWACEVGLWASEFRLQGCFVAEIMACEVLALPSLRLKDLIVSRPCCARVLASYGALFMRRFNSASAEAIPGNKLFNDKRVLNRIVQKCRLRAVGATTFGESLFGDLW